MCSKSMCVAGSSQTKPEAGTVRDHRDSFSDEVKLGLEGWMLERGEKGTPGSISSRYKAKGSLRAAWGKQDHGGKIGSHTFKKTMVSGFQKPWNS